MNCGDWQERIALYAGGDLEPSEAQAVERHVAECAGCQMLLSGLRQSLELLREAHGEPVEEAHFAAVRARVLAELERGRTRTWRFAWVYAMAAAAVVLLAVAMTPRTEQRLALPVPHAPTAPAIAKVGVKAPLPRRQVTDPSETVLMKIETDNPDVVIYWIAETKGETR
jgi:anti-sigma factor RsiW